MADAVLAIRDSGVRHERLDGEVIAIDLERGLYYGMAGTAADIWTLFARPTTVATVVYALARRYEAPPDEVRADVSGFVSQLEGSGLLVRAADTPATYRPPVDAPPSRAWATPVLETYDDLANLLLRDPTYLMDEHGWPHLPDPAP